MKRLAMRDFAMTVSHKAGLAAMALALTLSGCVSLGKEPPPTLFTLTPTALAAAGLSARGTAAAAPAGGRA